MLPLLLLVAENIPKSNPSLLLRSDKEHDEEEEGEGEEEKKVTIATTREMMTMNEMERMKWYLAFLRRVKCLNILRDRAERREQLIKQFRVWFLVYL